MVILDDFYLLKGNKNVLDLLPKEIEQYTVEDAKDLMQRSLEIRETRISHFTKKAVYKTISGDKIKVIVILIDNNVLIYDMFILSIVRLNKCDIKK